MNAGVIAACAGLALGAGAARAQVINWAVPVNGDWGVAGNWLPASVPDTAPELAVLGHSTGYVVTVAGGSYTVGGVSLANPLSELRLVSSPGLGTVLLGISGNTVNEGTIRLALNAGTTNNVRLQLNTPGSTLSGGGLVLLEEAGDAELLVNMPAGNLVNHAARHRITGAGRIYSGGGTLANAGSLRGDLAGGLQIDCPVTNTGTISALAPGAVTLTGTVTQSGAGAIEADGATVTLDTAIINGGPVGSVNGGVIAVSQSGGTVNGVTAAGQWRIPSVAGVSTVVLQVNTALTNNGQIVLPANPATTNNARLQFNTNGMTLSGLGEVRLEESGDTEFMLNLPTSQTLTQAAGHVIRGAGRVYSGGGTLVNNGVISGDLAGGMQLDVPVNNNSVIRAIAPGAMVITGSVAQAGPGYIEADAATITLDTAAVSGGVLRSVNGGLITVSRSGSTVTGLTADGMWTVPASPSVSTVVLQAATGLVNNGLIRLPADGATTNNARLQLNTSGMSLDGTGEVRLEEAGDAEVLLNVSAGGTIVNGATHTISGAGRVYSGGGTLLNHGTLRADLAGGLLVDCPVSNNGVMQARDAGSMTITNTVTQSGAGVIEADGATVTLDTAVLVHNSVRAANGGVISVATGGATLNDITAEGEWRMNASTGISTVVLHVVNGLTNDGLMRLPANLSTTNNARVQIDTPGMTISGTGELSLEDSGDTELLLSTAAGQSVTNGAGHTISGLGRIYSSGGTLRNAGVLAPGFPLGTLSLDCGATLLDTSIVDIELGGDGAGQRDLLDGTAVPVTLDGTLRVTFRDGYVLPACSSVVVVRGNLSGTFATLDLPVMPQGQISVSYGLTTVTVGYVPGDLNGDGLLDFADYLEFLNLYDGGDARADLNGDGLVDFADYLEFLNLYDAGC